MATSVSVSELYQEMEQMLGKIPEFFKAMPQSAMPALWLGMRDLEFAETAIPRKYKELIGLAVSGATRCRYCALFHTEAARLNGATDDEIAEASAMGAFTMFASTYLNAQQTDYEQFKKDTLDIIDFVRTNTGAGEVAAKRGEEPIVHA